MPLNSDGSWSRTSYRELRGVPRPAEGRFVKARFRVGDKVKLAGHPEVLTLLSIQQGVARVQGVGESVHEEPFVRVRMLTAKERREVEGDGTS